MTSTQSLSQGQLREILTRASECDQWGVLKDVYHLGRDRDLDHDLFWTFFQNCLGKGKDQVVKKSTIGFIAQNIIRNGSKFWESNSDMVKSIMANYKSDIDSVPYPKRFGAQFQFLLMFSKFIEPKILEKFYRVAPKFGEF